METSANPQVGPRLGGREVDVDGGWARLTEGCRRGDRACFEELVDRTESRLRGILGRLAGRGADLDDLIQETYLRAWRALPRFRGESGLTTWLVRIAINVAQNARRSRRPVVGLTELQGRGLAAPPALREDRLLDAYERALDGLSPDLRATFVLHEAEGMTYQRVAEALGCPIGTVMSRLHRARAQLLAALRDQVGEWAP